MTYHAESNSYSCNICGRRGFSKGQVTRPMAVQHKCGDCAGEALPGAPRGPRPQADPLRAEADRGAPVADVYYRRMSQGEYDAIMQNRGHVNLAAALDYRNARNYRLWFSTSRAKCAAFGNENNDDEGFVVRLTFNPGFSAQVRLLLQPHQMRGVQNQPDVIAFHREGFVQLGNVDTMVAMNLLLDAARHHNVGFTERHRDLLNRGILRIDQV